MAIIETDLEKNKVVLESIFHERAFVYKSKGEIQVQFHCPFCHHYKQKLSIRLNDGLYHCWVCNTKGKSYLSLLRRIGADFRYYNEFHIYTHNAIEDDIAEDIRLPVEYVPLYSECTDAWFKNAISYLKKRHISEIDIYRYKIGYCNRGKYRGRIIIPSYDSNNKLNFFVARSIYKHAKYSYIYPNIEKNIIMFQNLVDFSFPITLVEGVFDAISVRYNAIPLLGKSILPLLKFYIIKNKPPYVNIILDTDAKSDSLKLCNELLSENIPCKFVEFIGKDPNAIGHSNIWKFIDNTAYINKYMLYKMAIQEGIRII